MIRVTLPSSKATCKASRPVMKALYEIERTQAVLSYAAFLVPMALTSLLSVSNLAFATASFQLGGGLQKANLIADQVESRKLNFSGSTKMLGAHMQPLSALPLGLGVVLSESQLKGSDASGPLALGIKAISVEVSTWTKAGPVAFFLRGGQVVGSEASIYRSSSSVQSLQYSASHGSFGVATSVSSNISLMIEVKQTFNGSFEYLYGEEVLGKPRHLTSSSVLLGVELGA